MECVIDQMADLDGVKTVKEEREHTSKPEMAPWAPL
jgi:hypothetical protein